MKRADLWRARRVVVKLGTSLLTPQGRGVETRRFGGIARQVAVQMRAGRELVLVASGAVGLGTRRLGLARRPTSIPAKQAAAAVGQIDLCRRFERAFGREKLLVGQILLDHAGFVDRERFLYARRTLAQLLADRVVPIINENDSVATEELRFGDNDQLAAQVVNTCGADRAAGRFGVPTVIADGRRRDVLQRVLDGEDVGTFVRPAEDQLSSRKHWIAFTLRPRGALSLDAGAVRALRERRASLLPAGVTEVSGRFGVGDLVACLTPEGDEIARGLVSYDAREIDRIKRRKTSEIAELLGYSNGDEVIHRDNLIVF